MREPSRATSKTGGRLNWSSLAVLGLLLIAPVLALVRLAEAVDSRLLAVAAVATSAFTFWAYRRDKRQAQEGGWRIPESTLHLGGLVGGWPGGFLAQRIYRHKTAKPSFQALFWAIVLLHQALALDSLGDWKYTNAASSWVRAQVQSRH
jgi:uncharacterized membrane protein YsdA (DUF1294 family)